MEDLSFELLESNVLIEADCLKGVFLLPADRWIFWIGGLLVLFATCFLILSAIRFKEVRSQPGDLILGIALSDFLLAIHWLILATWYKEVDNPVFCTVVGAIGTFAGFNEFLYNSTFSIFMIISLRNALTQAKIPKKVFHIFNVAISGGYLIFSLLMGHVGKTLVGTCSIRSSCNTPSFYNYAGPAIVAIYTLIGLTTYCYIKKNVASCSQIHVKRTKFLLHYLVYVIISIVVYSIIASANLIQAIVLKNPSDENEVKGKLWANYLYNISKLCSPLVLSIVRFNDPFLRKAMRRTLCCWHKRRTDSMNTSLIQLEAPNYETGGEQMPEEESASSFEFTFIQLNNNRKLELTLTLLSCVMYAYQKKDRRTGEMLRSTKLHDNKTHNPHKKEQTFVIDDQTIKTSLPGVKEELEERKMQILPGTLKVYAPKVFSRFINDEEYIDVLTSLNFERNAEQILAAGSSEAGNTGEFFFYSEDRKLVIKTVPEKQIKTLVSILEGYENHFQEYPNSLIAKIYGAFTYESTEYDCKFHLILIKNVCEFSSAYVDRTYDLKGSRYGREVLRGQEVTNRSNLRNFVLKDLDFEKYEHKFSLEEDLRVEFMKQIEADSLFLRAMNIIDYSLIVFYVDKERYKQEMELQGLNVSMDVSNQLSSLRNLKESGMYYNVGIIDYLQPYNLKKILEKFFKRVKKLNPHLEMSTQDPDYYSERFIHFIKTVTN